MGELVDVAVVGASLAGSCVALRLARLGYSVLLVDQLRFPRRKVCGEGLSVIALRELDDLGLGAKLKALPHAPYYGFQFLDQGAALKKKSLLISDSCAHGIGIERFYLDQLMLDEVGQCRSATMHLGERPVVEKLSEKEFRIRGSWGECRSRFLVLACGGRSELPESFGIKTRCSRRWRSGASIQMESDWPLRSPFVNIYLEHGTQVCCTAVSDKKLNLSFMWSKNSRQRMNASVLKEMARRVCEAAEIKAHVCGKPLGASDIGRFHRESIKGNIFVTGDALGQLDPIGGMGMTQAFISGRVTSDTIVSMLSAGESLAAKARSTHRVRLRENLRMPYAYTRLSYLLLAQRVSSRVLRGLRTGAVAREILLSAQGVSGEHPKGRRWPAFILSVVSIMVGIL